MPVDGGWLSMVAVSVSLPGPIEYRESLRPGLGRPDSAELQLFGPAMEEWFDLLFDWIAVTVGQDTHYAEPIRNVHTPGQGLLITEARPDGTFSHVRSAEFTKLTSSESPHVEETTLVELLTRTNSGRKPSDARLILRDGWVDLRRGRFRRAVIDGGSAAEIALATWCRANNRTVGTKPTLGRYVKKAHAPIPAATQVDLVDVRNDAIHNNITPSRVSAQRALETAEKILNALEPI